MGAAIISVCNQKGGCGKTTLTMALAAAFAAKKRRVLVVDGDPQGSASGWSANAPEDDPFPATVVNLAHAGRSLPAELKKMVGDYDIVLIDCPPAVDSVIPQAALLVSDLALVPLIPSPVDVAAAAPFIRLIENARSLNPELRALVVPNMVQANTRVAAGYLTHLSALPVPATKVRLGLRTSHRQACALGSSVHALKDREGVKELDQLMREVDAVLRAPAASQQAVSA
jgi:chromosome partitioning protein